MDSFTYVSSYYDQPHLSELWWEALDTWDDNLCARIPIIYVDDGSPTKPLTIPDRIKKRFRIRHFRVLSDIPWNEMGARNLAMKHVNGWALLMDADYVMVGEQVHELLKLEPNPTNIYLPVARAWKEGAHLHDPINLFLCHSSTYWSIGGYHEGYAGHYGLSDSEMLRVHMNSRIGRQNRLLNVWIDHFRNGHVSWLDRSLDYNTKLFQERTKLERELGPLGMVKNNLHCNFKWEEVPCE